VLSDQQQFEKADSYYERAMKVDAGNANILVHRGLIQVTIPPGLPDGLFSNQKSKFG
jgi:hypothetical protein